MSHFFKKYWLFILLNVAIMLTAALLFMIVISSPQEGGVTYQM